MEMKVDEEIYPIKTVTNFAMYLDLKPPENPEKKTTRQSATRDGKQEEDTRAPDIRKHYKDSEKEQLFTLIYEKGMSARAAALKLQISDGLKTIKRIHRHILQGKKAVEDLRVDLRYLTIATRNLLSI